MNKHNMCRVSTLAAGAGTAGTNAHGASIYLPVRVLTKICMVACFYLTFRSNSGRRAGSKKVTWTR